MTDSSRKPPVSPEFEKAVAELFAPIEELVESMWEQLDVLEAELRVDD